MQTPGRDTLHSDQLYILQFITGRPNQAGQMQRQTSECLRVVAAPGRGFICLGATAAHNTNLRLATGTGRRAAAAVPWRNDAGQQTECPFWIMRRVGRARWLCQAECFRQVSAKTSDVPS
jgi:hypothetical protein